MELDFQVVIIATGSLERKEPKLFMPIANKPLIAYTIEILERSDFSFPRGVLIATRHECVRPLERYLEVFKRRNISNIEVVAVP
jgi:2-C-methyl-D-erythritol 4-phosphate cytidylyltransferase